MLDRAQLVHFARHGWVLLERVFDQRACARWIAAMDEVARWQKPHPESTPEQTVIEHLVGLDARFREWFCATELLDANRQLLGARLRFQGDNAHIKQPHPQRAAARDALVDPARWGWHRGMRPKWCNAPADDDAELLNCAFLNNITYLTPIDGTDDGGTAIRDGSHLIEDPATIAASCPVVRVTAPAGSVLVFTESLMHAGTPILSERTRYTMYYGFTPPWWSPWPGCEVPREVVAELDDPLLRELLGAASYGGQEAETLPGRAAVKAVHALGAQP